MADSTIGAVSNIGADGRPSTTSQTMSSTKSSTGKNATSKTTLDVEDFLALMVAEMQNQDPLEPTDNTSYMAQLATFSQVEATNEMNDNVLEQKASDLVGKSVIVTTDLNSEGFVGGVVDYWEKIEGTVYLGIGGKLYDIADLDTVMDNDYFNQWTDNIKDSNNSQEK